MRTLWRGIVGRFVVGGALVVLGGFVPGCSWMECGVAGAPCCSSTCHSGLQCVLNVCSAGTDSKNDGQRCVYDNECASVACGVDAITGDSVCAKHCVSASDCTPGWACQQFDSGRGCQCAHPTTEVCDGLDNDCDGAVDGPDADLLCRATDAETRCLNGACTCIGTVCSGECVDLGVSGQNCGGCGNACPDFAPVCAGGECRRAISTEPLFYRYGDPTVLHDGMLYRATAGSIWALGTATSTVTEVASRLPSAARGLAAGDHNLYWAGTSELHSIPLAGGSRTTLASLEFDLQGIAAEQSNVYWSTAAGLWSAADGATPLPLEVPWLGSSYIKGVSQGNLWIYNNSFVRLPLDGGTPATIDQTGCMSVVIGQGEQAYCVDGALSIVRLHDGDAPVHLGPRVEAVPQFILSDGTYLYWSSGWVYDPASATSLWRMPLTGGRVETVLASQPNVESVWVEPGALVWSSRVDGTHATFTALTVP